MKRAIVDLIVVVAVALLAFFFGKSKGRATVLERIEERIDTVYLHDTITQIKPVFKAYRVVDTICIKADTIRVNDTLFVQIPREEKVYSDSLYRAVISGYQPSLDSISIYSNTKIISQTITIPPKKWGWGFSVGPSIGIGVEGKPIIGASISWGFQYRQGK